MTKPKITDDDIRRAALETHCDIASMKAVAEVESRGEGFLADGRPKILFERHVMFKQLRQSQPLEVARAQSAHSDIVNPSPGGYLGGTEEWNRLDRAVQLDRNAALCSASWGKYQLMGFNYAACGFISVQNFVNAMFVSEGEHLLAFLKFVKANPSMLTALQRHDWTTFARLFNGAGYAANNYDTRLANAYRKFQNP